MGRPKKSDPDSNKAELDVKVDANPDIRERFYGRTAEFEHDIYKLTPALMRKNAGYNPRHPIWIQTEHIHYFHTIDSKGRRQKCCAPIGGHMHEVKTEETGGVPKIVSVGPPVVKRGKLNKDNGKITTVYMRVEGDDHIHPTEYMKSEKIRPAKMNAEFLKFQSENRQQIRPPAPNPELDKEFKL